MTSSMDLLMPGYKGLSKPAKAQDTPTCKPAQAAEKGSQQSDSAKELEKLSRSVIFSINNRSYVATKKLVAPTYRGDIDELPKNETYEETEEDFKAIAQANPEYQIDVVNVSADVDEESGYARVYCVLSVKGRPANVRRQSVSVVEWMRRDGSWQYFNASVLRGLDGSYMHNAQKR